MKDCVFCKIVAGEIPSKKVMKGDTWVAFQDINPIAPVHVLIVPKKHISRLAEATGNDTMVLGEIQLAAASVAKKMNITEAFRVLMANGKEAGQSVFHIHYHVIGGWKDKPPAMETNVDLKGGKS